ncbi:hypothetical protein ACJ72_08158 [Emergomyces africanus]|uniref:Uncharacterized protein n=1 Tax=Emergomyces africanus TaxID=1955775 RepID=A0A1B7NL46_9EURO|nr:hypothetical protein ACJ72_08158 [Emergomyces africanus]
MLVEAAAAPGHGQGDGHGGSGMYGRSSGGIGGWRTWAGLRRVTGRSSGGDAERFEGLRRRLEGESRAAAAAGGARGGSGQQDALGGSGSGDGGDGARERQRRPLAGQILDRFTGSF